MDAGARAFPELGFGVLGADVEMEVVFIIVDLFYGPSIAVLVGRRGGCTYYRQRVRFIET